jgi:hypothetical protein
MRNHKQIPCLSNGKIHATITNFVFIVFTGSYMLELSEKVSDCKNLGQFDSLEDDGYLRQGYENTNPGIRL